MKHNFTPDLTGKELTGGKLSAESIPEAGSKFSFDLDFEQGLVTFSNLKIKWG